MIFEIVFLNSAFYIALFFLQRYILNNRFHAIVANSKNKLNGLSQAAFKNYSPVFFSIHPSLLRSKEKLIIIKKTMLPKFTL